MPHSKRPGDLLGGRYRLVDLLAESAGGRFWRAHDRVLARHVAVHVIAADDPRADLLLDAARAAAGVHDRRVLRVLDADRDDAQVWVVNEWGSGTSLDLVLADGPLGPRRAAFVAGEAAEAVAVAHARGIAHGRLVPENVLVDHAGHVRLIGLAVDAALHGLPPDRVEDDVVDLGGLLYAGLTGRWAGTTTSAVEAAPREAGRVLRPRRVRAGVPRGLDQLCDALVNDGDPSATGGLPVLSLGANGAGALLARGEGRPAAPGSARELADVLREVVGDPAGLPASLAAAAGPAARPVRPVHDTPAEGVGGLGSSVGAATATATAAGTATATGGPATPPPGPFSAAETASGTVVAAGSTVTTGADPAPDPAPEPAPEPDAPSASEPTRVVPVVAPPPPHPAESTAEPTAEPEAESSADPEPTRAVPVAPVEDDSAGEAEPTRAVPLAGGLPPADPPGPPAPTDEADQAGTGVPDRTDQPTEAGVPIFHEGSDDVDWLRKRSVQPPPPPPFEEPPERPLFAPDPAPGEPLRRARPGAEPARGGDEYWPWGDTGTGRRAPLPPPPADEPDDDDGRVPGRRTLRLALLMALVLLTALAVVAAFNLARGGSPLGGGEAEEPAPEPTPTAEPLRAVDGLEATDLDPQGDPPEENPELAPLVVDGDPATTWRTSTYDQQLGPGGLKTGVGLVVDLGEPLAPREVTVQTLGGPTSAQLFLTDEQPTSVEGLTPVAEPTGEGALTARLDGDATGRYLVVWLVELPDVGGFRGEVAEVRVRR